MKVSIITVTFNSFFTLQNTIDSVIIQNYKDLEYIIVDGNSTDGTVDIIRENGPIVSQWISEPDTGLYDAINKGIRMATGDIVGLLHSDDFYHRPDAISQVVDAFQRHPTDCVFADVIFVKPEDLTRQVRYYDSGKFNLRKFKFGIMPAHPTFFTYRKNFDQYGLYRTDYTISADFELMVRFLYTSGLTYQHIPKDLVCMRTGGLSTKSWKSNLIMSQEDLRSCLEHGIKSNYFWLYSRYFSKLLEFFPSRS